MGAEFPRQDIPESKKNKAWCKKMLDYAVSQFEYLNRNRERILRLRRAYNGTIDKRRIQYLTNTYGKKIKTRFIDYKIGRPKIDLVNGEWLKRTLNSTVQSENKEAKNKKMDKYYRTLGMMEVKPQLEELKELVGFDPYQGMELPNKDNMDQPRINVKLKNEVFMQHALNHHIRIRDMKTKLSKNFKDLEITSETFGMIDLKENGTVDYIPIKPENAIYIESENDDFLQHSPIMGHKRYMFVQDILSEYSQDKEFQGTKGKELRDKLEQLRGDSGTYNDIDSGYYKNWYKVIGEELAIIVYRIEWKSSRPVYTKIFPNNRRAEISPEYYEKNKKKIQNDEKNKKYELRKEWKIELWESTRIGQDIDIRCRRKPYQLRSVDPPHDPWYSYVGLLFNTENGIRVSLLEMLDDISFLYNVVMFQINRELAKAKGKAVAYDLAGLPKGQTMKDIMYNLADDGLYLYNSSQEGNKIGRDVMIQGTIKEIDLGISNTISVLIPLKAELQLMADRLTGITEERQGQISASSTVTNAQSNIVASRTMTEPMFYYMERFTERVFSKMLEAVKVAWGLMSTGEADLIIGDEGKGFLKATSDIANDDYGVYLIDGREEQEIKAKLDMLAQVSVNAKELRLQDWLKVSLAETLGEAQESLEKGWKEMEEARMQADQMRNQTRQQELQQQMQMAIEDREDKQEHDINKIMVERGLDGMAATDKDEAKMREEQYKGSVQQKLNKDKNK
ncbi:hypothetical protein CMI37_13160 [Candidatus Pacearchaeota archaeon]|nr:hypothetical protein [Candidatus Pacearchaeota archaeon]